MKYTFLLLPLIAVLASCGATFSYTSPHGVVVSAKVPEFKLPSMDKLKDQGFIVTPAK